MYKSTFKITILTILVTALAGICFAQKSSFPKPHKERLLNELDVLLWRQPEADKIAVSLRIHSGSAFDPEGKDGAINLLTAVMFPDTGTFEDFQELGGTLSVSSNFDYIQIDVIANKDKLVTVLEILSDSVSKPAINKESTEAAKKALLEKIREDSENPKLVADSAVAERLYGSFPYGRSQKGTEETLADIDFADLIFLQQRFLNAGNATVAISGDVDIRFANRAARRLFGSWQKGNGRVESNFTLPEDPDTAPLTINTDAAPGIEERFAVEAVSRKDDGYFAAMVLSNALRQRIQTSGQSITYDAYLLRGFYTLSRVSPKLDSETDISGSDSADEIKQHSPLADVLKNALTEAEFDAAKAKVIAAFKDRNPSGLWFDIDTYGLKSVDDEVAKLNSVTLSDVNKLAAAISNNPIVEVNVFPTDAAELQNDGDPNDPN